MKRGLPPEYLVEELARKAQHLDKPLERRLADLTIWFYHNRRDVPTENLGAKVKLLETGLWTVLEVCALLLERQHELEAQKNGSELWLPKGVKVGGDLSRFE